MSEAAISDFLVDLIRLTYKVKLAEYDADFKRDDKPENFWREKYGTGLHATYLGERWAMRKALEICFESKKGPLE